MSIESVRVYPREVICGECGIAMMLSWYNPMELSQGGNAVYQHPNHPCEFKNKRIRATCISCSAQKDEWEE